MMFMENTKEYYTDTNFKFKNFTLKQYITFYKFSFEKYQNNFFL